MLTPFFFLDQTSPRSSAMNFEGNARSICADILNKWEDEVDEDDLDRVTIVQMERQTDGELIDAVMFDDAIVGSLDRPIPADELPLWSRL